MSAWERIDAELKRRGRNWQWLADEMGYTIQRLQNWKTRGVPRNEHGAIADALEKSTDWVSGRSRLSLVAASNADPNDVVISHFATGGSMGHGLLLHDQPGVIHSWHVTPEWIKKNVKSYTATGNLCIVTGFGDSMRPMFNPGDPLLVDRGVTTVDVDAVYFFRVGQEGFIKRLQRIPGEGIIAISENKAYRDWFVKHDMDFEVLGRVLKVWRGEEFF